MSREVYQEHFDIVFMDYSLPDTTADKVVVQLRRFEAEQRDRPRVHCCAMLDRNQAAVFPMMMQSGADHAVTKPLRPDDLAQYLRLFVEFHSEQTNKSSDTHSDANTQLQLLVCDDEKLQRQIIGKALETLGHVVDLSEDGDQALAKMQSKQYSVVFMDINMPTMTGDEAVRQFREWEMQHRPGCRMNICALTADKNSAGGDEARFYLEGFDGAIGKPARPVLLAEYIIQSQIRAKRMEARQAEIEAPVTPSTPIKRRTKRDQLTVLFVEQEEVLRDLIAGTLKAEGYAVQTAADGLLALRMMQSDFFDVVFMNVLLPRMNGAEATKRYRLWEHEHRKTVRTNICALRGEDSAPEGRYLAQGFDGVVDRPAKRIIIGYLEGYRDKLPDETSEHDVSVSASHGDTPSVFVIVHEDQEVRLETATVIEECGCEVIGIANSSHALERIKQADDEAVALRAVLLSPSAGADTLGSLRQWCKSRSLPIAMFALAPKQQSNRLQFAVYDGVLPIPLTDEVFRATQFKCLSVSGSSSDLSSPSPRASPRAGSSPRPSSSQRHSSPRPVSLPDHILSQCVGLNTTMLVVAPDGEWLSTTLQSLGCTVEVVHTAKAALELLQTQATDAIFVNVDDDTELQHMNPTALPNKIIGVSSERLHGAALRSLRDRGLDAVVFGSPSGTVLSELLFNHDVVDESSVVILRQLSKSTSQSASRQNSMTVGKAASSSSQGSKDPPFGPAQEAGGGSVSLSGHILSGDFCPVESSGSDDEDSVTGPLRQHMPLWDNTGVSMSTSSQFNDTSKLAKSSGVFVQGQVPLDIPADISPAPIMDDFARAMGEVAAQPMGEMEEGGHISGDATGAVMVCALETGPQRTKHTFSLHKHSLDRIKGICRSITNVVGETGHSWREERSQLDNEEVVRPVTIRVSVEAPALKNVFHIHQLEDLLETVFSKPAAEDEVATNYHKKTQPDFHAAVMQAKVAKRCYLRSFDLEATDERLDALRHVRAIDILDLADNRLNKLVLPRQTVHTVTRLSLKKNRFREIPEVIRYFEHLHRLNLDQNSIVVLPAFLGDMKHLEVLSALGNHIDVVPPSLFNAPLEKLNLSQNNITHLPAEIGQCTTLVSLELSSCRLRELPPELANCTRLSRLNLRSNQLKFFGATMAGLKGLLKTKQLHIDRNPFPAAFKERYQAGVAALFQYLQSFELTEEERIALSLEGGGTTTSKLSWSRGKILGQGAFGCVYLGLDNRTGKMMAVKCLALDSENARKQVPLLEREIILLKNLHGHPNVVNYLGAERGLTELNLFMEFVAGGSVHSILKMFGAFSITVTRRFGHQCLLGLEHLHRHQIVHRDIKAANLLVTERGIVKLADFGLSKRLDDTTDISHGSGFHGTLTWMAPEVIRGKEQGFPSDVWSFGITVIEMLTGPRPPDVKQEALMLHRHRPPPLPEHLPQFGVNFLEQCFKRKPKNRMTCTELLQHDFVNLPD